MKLRWFEVRPHIEAGVAVVDAHGVTWRRTEKSRVSLYRIDGEGNERTWVPYDSDEVTVPPPLPEPPDGTRIEFEHGTDVYAAHRDDASSAQAGWSSGNGGYVWCLYGESVPKPWAIMWLEFGDSLRTAVRLVPVREDAANREKWPTVMNAREKAGAA